VTWHPCISDVHGIGDIPAEGLSALCDAKQRVVNFDQYPWFHSGWDVAVNQITSLAVLCTIWGTALALAAVVATLKTFGASGKTGHGST
jgi:hypothetical protein